ncbi:MAG: 7,8-didemethyl-8-hydroxy-5-deazariboflavin synthase CofG [Deltaproteobacteria bacterium]|nr:7,8-didemethyl-8-hydroxy-5-deazariboflavin synthase CofG [Deltaproteobacteria bacterium]MBI2538464.1 7,8-didemethyl-8-hydroxy-5-deazariboflavin synthase CofG [Deltaproteobacteria bacterium]MBI2991221.1 7,8-didemethyl-8-hydroxy-5-deazariboflavin synthase CofG [Deltaproteobacteria bacterium]MBI3060527.1 7,8-didemethyl-8-hydroxy-5-deazariboflavin synthase CofG [Deltaproteobacteria bacterium]
MNVTGVLKSCLGGKILARSEALALSAAGGEELAALLSSAAELRDRHKGKTVTFSPKLFIPLTNLCRDFCGYCTFRRAPDEAGARTMTQDEVRRVVLQGQDLGCTEVLFSLGDRPEAIYPEMREFLSQIGLSRTLDYLYEACKMVLEESGLLPHSNPGLMGKRDLARLKQVNVSLGLMLENLSERLLLPSGPHFNAPDKKPALRLKTIEEAGRLRIPFTTGILIGIGESWLERIDSLFAIRDLHGRYGHIQEVIIQNFRAKPEIPMRDHPEPSVEEMLKTIALARLILGGEMNIQAPPNLTPESYPLYLRAGINDWGGVSPLTPDYINPEAPWPALALLSRKTAEAGYLLRPRLAVYPEFIFQGEKFIPASLLPHVERLCGEDGLVRNGTVRGLAGSAGQDGLRVQGLQG